MSYSHAILSAALLALSQAAAAEAPKVATDVLPIHGLVSRVMEGVGTPDLIIPPGASPHGYSMRPSEALALEQADVVVWVGDDLSPWLADPVATLANDATVLTLANLPQTTLLPARELVEFEMHGDDHDGEHGDDHKDEHDHGHDHGEHDPHIWLDPENAKAWLAVIAKVLSVEDAGNSELYEANAEQGAAEIDAVVASLREGALEVQPAIAFHDSFQYFEVPFNLPVVGAVSLSDASVPGPATLSEIRAYVEERNVACLLVEPGTVTGLVAAVIGGTNVKEVPIDQLGRDIPPGPQFYPELLRSIGASFHACSQGEG